MNLEPRLLINIVCDMKINKTLDGGKLFVLEGPDGVGKSTISKDVTEYFNSNYNNFVLLTFPGKEVGTLGKVVYDLHHQPDLLGVNKVADSSNQLLHIAAHIDAIEQIILPQIKDNKNIILDRFWWSAWVYGRVLGLKNSFLKKMIELEKLVWKNLQPSAVFLLQRNAPVDRDVDIKNWKTIVTGYDNLAEKEQFKYSVVKVDNNNSINEATTSIIETIRNKLSNIESDKPNLIPHKKRSSSFFSNYEMTVSSSLKKKNVSVFVSPSNSLKTTVVYDTYWKFAAERQNVFFKKLNNSPLPWTEDSIISKHKFTNAYRASDRVSQFLIKNVIYDETLPQSNLETFFRIILFKLFNKIETWNVLKKELGEITYEGYSFEKYDKILSKRMKSGKTIYSAAYIMPSGGKILGYSIKHKNHLKLIEMMMRDELYKKLQDCKSMKQGFKLLLEYPTIGNFLAYQFITDINYSEITDFDENEFVVPGPGALDGIRKCFSDKGNLPESDLIRLVADNQEPEFNRLGLHFKSLWGRPLQLIDCQNLFCEVDKYSRVKHPEISGITGRTRIKQIYKPVQNPISYWYPPKWEINHKITRDSA